MASLSVTIRAHLIAEHYILMQIGNHWTLKDLWELPAIEAKHDN